MKRYWLCEYRILSAGSCLGDNLRREQTERWDSYRAGYLLYRDAMGCEVDIWPAERRIACLGMLKDTSFLE